jgi:methyl-accepting chemotaxis protein
MFSGLFNANIGKRIFIAAIVPIIGIALFAAYIVSAEFSRYSSLSQLHTLATVSPKISSVIHELQSERAISSSYISTGGTGSWATRLDQQFASSDAVLTEILPYLQAFPAANYGALMEERLTLALTELERLEGFRDRTKSARTTVEATDEYYTQTIRQFLDIVSVVSSIADDAEIKGRSIAYTSLLEIKERAGLERAKGTHGYGNKSFDSLTHTDFVTLIGQQDSYLAVFRAFGSPDSVAFYDETVAGTSVDDVEYWRDIAVEAGYDVLYDDVTGIQWFDGITAKINLIKQVEDYVSASLIETADNALSSAWTALLITLASSIGSLIVAGAACYVVGRSITKPLAGLQDVMGEVADGAFDIEIAGKNRSDEIGDMARAVEVFRDQGAAAKRLKEEQQIAETRAAEQKREDLNKMADDLETSIGQMIDALTASSGELETTARSMSELAGTTNEEAISVSTASAGATQNVETVASAASQLSNAIGEVTEQISLSAALTQESRAASEQTDVQMNNLSEAANRIGSVMELIQEIAEQTNLLALNATIEAARAGDAGKGFAVVASEVKDLANQTAKATGEISDHVNRVQEETRTAAEAMTGIASKIGEINQVTSAVSAAVEEQSSATLEISRSAEETAEMNRNVSSSVETVRSAAEQTGTAANKVLSSAEELSQTAVDLRKQVGDFVASIRAA